MIVIPEESHSPKLLAETEKEIVGGLDEPQPPPPPPIAANTPIAAAAPAGWNVVPVVAIFGFGINIFGSNEL